MTDGYAVSEVLVAIGKYRVRRRCPTLRTRPARLRSVMGRCSSRAVPPTSAIKTFIPSPGFAQTASYRRSPSAAICAGGRRRLVVVVMDALRRVFVRVFAERKARSTAVAAALWHAATCSRTNPSI